MAFGKRRSERVEFAKGLPARMVGIDGSWKRECLVSDASATGARLTIKDSLAGLEIKEFFLLLSSTGLVFRRCRMVRFAGDQIGIEFIPTESSAQKTWLSSKPGRSG